MAISGNRLRPSPSVRYECLTGNCDISNHAHQPPLGSVSVRTFLRPLGGNEILYSVGPTPQLLSWLRDFRTEVIYGHCSTLNSVRFLRRMQQALGLPLVLHFMDDWPKNLYMEGWASQFVRRRYLAEFAELVRSADVTIAICEEMAEEYRRRYQRPVMSLHMPVELGAYHAATRTEWSGGRPFRLRYGGRVGWAIRESLADIRAGSSFTTTGRSGCGF